MTIMTKDQIVAEATRVLRSEASSIQDAANRLEEEGGKELYNTIYYFSKALDEGGKIVVTGVGKSGHIGKKIVATFQSVGCASVYLHPVEALHGDIGIVGHKDIILAISFSGNTEEILHLVPSIKQRGVPIIGLGGNENSKLAKECIAWLDGNAKEVSNHIPAPTSSTAVALALGDAIAVILMQLRSFTKQAFALNHPGGSLGRVLLYRVKDIMTRSCDVPIVEATTTLDAVIAESMRKTKCGAVFVTEPASPSTGTPSISSDPKHNPHIKIIGIITDEDMRRALSYREQIFCLQARDIMTCDPVSCSIDDLASEAMRLMKEREDSSIIPVLPVYSKDNWWKGAVTLKSLEELF